MISFASGLGVSDYLPDFYARVLDRLDYPLSWLSGNYSDFGAWRRMARSRALDLLCAPPPWCDLNPELLSEEDRGSYTAQKIGISISQDCRTFAYLLVPQGAGPFPAVQLLHDHGARFDIGKEKVIRPIDESNSKNDSAQEWVESCYGGRFIGDELARRGYVCFCTDALNWSDRQGAGFEGQQALASNLFHMGMSLAGLIAWEDMRAADFVSALPMVDSSRIAAMGLSMGAYRTWQLAALSDVISAGVAICWMATIASQMQPGINQSTGQSAYTMLHPGMSRYLDFPDVASIACPKPMLFYNGLQDGLFPVKGVKDAYAKLEHVWQSQGVEARLETRLWNVPHAFTVPMQSAAFGWLDQVLNLQFPIENARA